MAAYILTYTDTNDTVTYSSKKVAIAAGERADGKSFTVVSPSGKLVHEYTAPKVEAKPAAKKATIVEEVGNTIRGLTTVALDRTCRKGADHEFRVARTGHYCYTCDRIAAEAQKAARAAAKQLAAEAEAHANGTTV